MSFIYVTEQGAYIKKKGPRIQVIKDGEMLADRAVKEVQTLVLFGGVHPTTEAMLSILDNGGDVAMMTIDGHFKGKMVSAKGKNSVLRVAQYSQFANKDGVRKWLEGMLKRRSETVWMFFWITITVTVTPIVWKILSGSRSRRSAISFIPSRWIWQRYAAMREPVQDFISRNLRNVFFTAVLSQEENFTLLPIR